MAAVWEGGVAGTGTGTDGGGYIMQEPARAVCRRRRCCLLGSVSASVSSSFLQVPTKDTYPRDFRSRTLQVQHPRVPSPASREAGRRVSSFPFETHCQVGPGLVSIPPPIVVPSRLGIVSSWNRALGLRFGLPPSSLINFVGNNSTRRARRRRTSRDTSPSSLSGCGLMLKPSSNPSFFPHSFLLSILF